MRLRLLFYLLTFASAAGLRAAERPNIVLIMADDMGWSDIGCYGAEIIQTPNLDRLAREGLRFRQFYNNAKCTTTRASLLTGLYPRNGGRGIELLDERMVTLAEALAAAGYRTGLSGKWHNGSRAPHRPIDRGFERSYGLWDGCCNFFDPSLPDPKFKGGRVRFFGRDAERISDFPDDFFTTDAFAREAVGMIEEFASGEEPFFLYVPFTAPHYPLHAEEEDIAKYRGKFRMGWDELQQRRHRKAVEIGLVDASWTLPPRDREAKAWSEVEKDDWQFLRMEVYAAMVDAMDQGIGRILAALEHLQIDGNTLVLFLSDNGSCAETPGGNDRSQVPGSKEFYSHVGPGWAYAQNAPFRRYKSRMHEGGIATPLIARWPRGIPAGTITNQVGHIVDFMPTFLELAGGEYPASVGDREIRPAEGVSLAPVLGNPAEIRTRQQPLFWYFNGSRAIRDGDWKLVWDAKLKRWELYNLARDRTETDDRAAADPARAARLERRWQEWASRTGVRVTKGKAK